MTPAFAWSIVLILILLLVGAGILHGANLIARIKNSTYLRSALIIFASAAVGGVLLLVGYGWASIAPLAWFLSVLLSTLTAYGLYHLYFKIRFSRFLAVWVSAIMVWLVSSAIVLFAFDTRYQLYTVYDDFMAPSYHRGDLVLIQKNAVVGIKGEIIFARIVHYQTRERVLQIERIRGVAGDTEQGTKVPNGSVYVANDVDPQASGTILPAAAILGRPVLNLGTF